MNLEIQAINNNNCFDYKYQKKDSTGEKYFLNDDNNNLREGVSIQNFYPGLKEKATVFEKNFGDLVRKQKVVK